MALYAIIQSIVWGIVRHLAEDLSTPTLYFFRNFIGFLTIVPLISKKGLTVFKTEHFKLHLLRALAAFLGGLSIFYAVANAPLATVVAITFAAPIFASLFSIYLFGEAMNKTKGISLVTSFIGVLFILRPNLDIETDGLVAAIVASIATAIAFLTVKKLAHVENAASVIAYPFLLILPLSMLLALLDWTQPKMADIPLLLTMVIGISAAQYCMVKAFSLADASAVLPFDFLRLLVATFVGSFFFDDLVDTWIVVGASLILTSSLYIAKKGKQLPSRNNRKQDEVCE